MTQELQKALIDVITGLTSAANQAGAMAQQQLPLVIQEYLRWGMADALFFVGLGLLLLILGLGCVIKGCAILRRERYNDLGFGLNYGGLFGMAVGFIMTFINLYAALHIYVAPRVYLLEQLKGLLK